MSRRVLVHGFTQTAVSWGRTTEELGAIAVDAPVAPLWDAAAELARHGPATFIGYSMGGRLALHVALAHPDVVTALVLVSATAGIEDDAERAARRASDDALADRAEAIGAAAFVDEWVAQPMFAGVPPVDRCRDVATIAGHLRLAGTGTQEPLWPRLGEITVPVLVVTGARDTRFCALGERLAAGLPDARLVVIEGAGHAVPFERPDAFVAAVRAFGPAF